MEFNGFTCLRRIKLRKAGTYVYCVLQNRMNKEIMVYDIAETLYMMDKKGMHIDVDNLTPNGKTLRKRRPDMEIPEIWSDDPQALKDIGVWKKRRARYDKFALEVDLAQAKANKYEIETIHTASRAEANCYLINISSSMHKLLIPSDVSELGSGVNRALLELKGVLSVVGGARLMDISGMFSGCIDLSEIDLRNFNTSNVSNMMGLFRGCANLTKIVFGDLFNTSKVNNLSHMFEGCRSIEELNLNRFTLNGLADISYMFASCESLMKLDLSNFNLRLGGMVDRRYMFYGCNKDMKLLAPGVVKQCLAESYRTAMVSMV